MNESLPNRSARILGRDHGLNAVEMNLALKGHGYLEGEPGAYRVTEKGLPFATETFESRGTGGYPQYNPSWETRTWNPKITDELNITDALKQSVRAEASLLRQRQAEARVASSIAGERGGDGGGAARQLDVRRLMIGVAVALGVTSSAYGIWRLYDHRRKNRLANGNLPAIDTCD